MSPQQHNLYQIHEFWSGKIIVAQSISNKLREKIIPETAFNFIYKQNDSVRFGSLKIQTKQSQQALSYYHQTKTNDEKEKKKKKKEITQST